ncbi:hypothetical protein AGMMS4956_00780 [Bacteroidia bacterium]|nr:hypothetical protein AGMMS4956_00780 [Bacteroidia bacterium]
MLITIEKSTGVQEIDNLIRCQPSKKLFHSQQFVGKVKWGEDAMQYQKRVRNEWD